MRLPLSIAVLLFTLVAAGVGAAPPPGTSPAGGSAAPAPQRSPADAKRVAAIGQYEHDLVNVVALRADPSYLLGAAIVAKPFVDPTPGLDFDSLSARAAAGTGAGPATRWARLPICHDKSDCPNAEAYGYLRKHASDNAAVWLVALDVAAEKDDAVAEREALAKAAAASIYDDYYGKALAGVARVVDVLPPLADTTRGAHSGQPDNPAGVKLLVALKAMQSHPRPELDPLIELCGKKAIGAHPVRRAPCLKLAHTLQWGSSPVARAAGLHIQGELDPARDAQDRRASTNLAWQVHEYSRLLQHALTDPAVASHWLATARNGGTELSLILATLRANHVPLEAPAGATASASNGS